MTRPATLSAVLFLTLAPLALAAQVTPPPGWSWDHDVRGASPDSAGWAFTSMAPGFHLTTTAAGATLYPSDQRIVGRRGAEAKVILFPGTGGGAYGLGVTNLDAPGEWVGALVRRDGSVAVTRVQRGMEQPVPWTPAEAVAKPDSNGYSTNLLRIAIGTDEVVFLANGKSIGSMPRASLPARPAIAFRMGPGLNMHVTSFDMITPMAPVPAAKKTP